MASSHNDKIIFYVTMACWNENGIEYCTKFYLPFLETLNSGYRSLKHLYILPASHFTFLKPRSSRTLKVNLMSFIFFNKINRITCLDTRLNGLETEKLSPENAIDV